MKPSLRMTFKWLDSSSNQCLGCLPGFTPQDATGSKCVDLFNQCKKWGGSTNQCAPCMPSYPGPETCPKPTPECTSPYANIQEACSKSAPGSVAQNGRCIITYPNGDWQSVEPLWACPSSCSVCFHK